jgi:hypothetical protein
MIGFNKMVRVGQTFCGLPFLPTWRKLQDNIRDP